MDSVKLTISLTEEYRKRIDEVRLSEELRKCRSWTDLLAPAAESAEVELNGNYVLLKCNTLKGAVQDSCTYDGVLAVTEMKDGILLRLSHKRLLWLPVSEDGSENELLMNAMMLLCEHCKCLFRTSRLKLKGVDIKQRIVFRFRSRQGYDTSDSLTKRIIIAFICLSLFSAVAFVSEPFRNQKIDRENAIMLSAVFDSVDRVYGKHGVQYVNLQFQDAEAQSVDGCCLGYGLQEKLENLPSGTQMQLLIHPDSGNVLQIVVAGEILLEFDDAQNQLWREACFFPVLGAFMIVFAVFLIYILIRKKFGFFEDFLTKGKYTH